ncbi:Protein involved in Cu(II)/Cu(I) resistance(Secreted) [Cupriavidus respiraculi]|uniref:Protein involved in Cu(II)/Cu(I) resistance(Secreted) n=2 Tax=Cupriavidus TaxID=106589 RepID=A0A849BGP1_9BURK|nr:MULTISPECIES: hypothetical protein [Cupriavidus]KAB0595219.1 hypothetical protein F7Q96_18035 [Cupriavidus gilardii]MBY4949453.1 hypothetical protein [Cupriavidus respiraculi]MCT9015596.1 hypothetical protein [Cupriavidus gilardii]MCT9055366.1 hypothetical protein [Cupriavidus gilardii]NNH13278.1 hypothetical protein [Cupriavidus gilardii]
MLKLKRTALVALTVTTLGSIAGFAHAGVNSPRDPFTEGAHAMGTRDPYTHGGHTTGTRDPFTDGNHAAGDRDTFTDGA